MSLPLKELISIGTKQLKDAGVCDAEADAKEQKSYMRNAKGELKDSGYDTDYNFIDYPLPDGNSSKMGRTVTDMKYIEFFHNIHNPGDRNCYMEKSQSI